MLLPTQRLHLDHIVPRCEGGRDDIGNLQVTHAGCNLRKGDGTRDPNQPRRPKAYVWYA